jgi:type IV secretory pathway VirB4 component
MLKLQRIFKNYEEAGSLSAQVNLYGFIGPEVFLTKSGEVGVVLALRGVDYECLDQAAIDGYTKRLESALKIFDEQCRVYQYLFKRNNQSIPFALYGNPVVDAAIRNRIAYLESKADTLYALSVYYVVLLEGSLASERLWDALKDALAHPSKRLWELCARPFSTHETVLTLGKHLDQMQVALLRVLKQTLNFDPEKLGPAELKHDTFLDYYLPESHIECHRRHLLIDQDYVKVLTLKEPSAESFPLIFKRLLEVGANFHIVTEWKKQDSGKTRRTIQAKRRHFHNTKRSFRSQMSLNDASQQDVLLDDSKQAQVRELGESLEEIEIAGNYFGLFSLTVVIYDRDLARVERACSEFYKVFTVYDAQLYQENFNLLNAFLAAVPGNHAFN